MKCTCNYTTGWTEVKLCNICGLPVREESLDIHLGQKEKPSKPCVFLTRAWNDRLQKYNYDIWRFEWVEFDDKRYLAWLTEDGEEWDDIKECNFDEYFIIEEGK